MPQFFVFALVGVLNTVIDALVYLALTRWMAAPPILANICGFLAGSINSYVVNGVLTFSVAGKNLRSPVRFIRFLAITALTLVFSTLCFAAAILIMPDLAAKAIATLLTVAANYHLSRRLVFNRRDG